MGNNIECMVNTVHAGKASSLLALALALLQARAAIPQRAQLWR
jgi:hypothetical protein